MDKSFSSIFFQERKEKDVKRPATKRQQSINFIDHIYYDISRLKYMFIMYIYVTGVLDKVPNTIFTKTKQRKKGFVEDRHTR